jgi:hypothetical protein
MTKVFSVRNLGDFGLNTDLSSMNLSPEYFTYATNFRLRNGNIETYFGRSIVSTAPVSFNPTKIINHVSSAGDFYVLCGKTAVYTYDGINWIDVTPTILATTPIATPDEHNWSMCNSGNCVIINNPQTGPFYLSPTGTKFEPLPWDATHTWQALNKSCLFIRSHKQFLFAFGIFDTTVFGARDLGVNTYAWSTAADINGLPFTWDPLDLSAIAGNSNLSATGGYIIDAYSLRDSMCIYSRKSIDILDYVGGEFIWSARQLTSDTGVLASNCVAEFYNKHLILTDGDILINDGNSLASILTKKLKNRLSSNIDSTYYSRSFVVINTIYTEVWVCIPENGNTYPNIAIIYNWLEDKVYLRDIAMNAVDASIGPRKTSSYTWANEVDSWDGGTGTWSDNPDSPFNASFVGLDKATSAIYSLVDNNSLDGVYTTALERINVPLEGHTKVTTAVALYPLIDTAGTVLIQMGASTDTNSILWKPPVVFDPRTMKKVDIRTTGSYHSWRIESRNNVPFSMNGFDIEYEDAGRR